jgi:hypothetical protein
MRLRTMPFHVMPRSPTQRPTAFEVRLKTQWESADTTEPLGMLDISKLACQAAILRLWLAARGSRKAARELTGGRGTRLTLHSTGGALCREMTDSPSGGTDSPTPCDGALRQPGETPEHAIHSRAPGSQQSAWLAAERLARSEAPGSERRTRTAALRRSIGTPEELVRLALTDCQRSRHSFVWPARTTRRGPQYPERHAS